MKALIMKLKICVALPCLLGFIATTQAAEQGSKLFKRPSATLPALPDYVPEQEPETLTLPDPAQMTQPLAGEKQFFRLTGIKLTGNHAISDAELMTAVDEFMGEIISVADLEHIRLALSQVYKDQGYSSSGAILEDQHISDGMVKFKIIEGRLEKINIKNAQRLRDSYISDRLLINNEGPLKTTELQKSFQLLLADPLIDHLNGVLKPGTRPGSTILDLDVTRNPQPYALYVSFDNYTPPSIGAYTGRFGGFIRNLTGFADVAGLEIDISEGLKSLDFNFAIPINRYNTRFLFDFQTSNAKIVESSLARQDIESDFYHIEFALSHPVYNALNRKFIMDARFAYRENTTSFQGGQPLQLNAGADENGRSAVSVLRLTQNFIDRGQNHAVSLQSIFSIGIDAFGSSVHANRPDSQFFSWIGQANYAHRLDDKGTQVILRGSVQLSDDALLPLERYALGGHATVRGYRENYRVTDEGYFVAAELEYPLLHPADFAGHSLIVVPFIDVGGAWNRNQKGSETLYSAGIGLKWGWERLNAQLFWAHAFNSPDSETEYDLQDDGIQFQLSTRIF